MYKEVETMTPVEFMDWWAGLSILEKFAYHAFIFKHLAEGKNIEIIRGKGWVEFHPEYEPDVINRHCRIKPQPKELKYKPYEKADPRWLVETNKVLHSKYGKTFKRISEVDPNNKKFSVFCTEYWYSLDELFNSFEWYDLETGETTPFGEAYYE